MKPTANNLPDGWFVMHGQPEPTPEEIERVAAEIRSEWSPGRESVARGVCYADFISVAKNAWTPPEVSVPPPSRKPLTD